nr:mandelate racemase/muconate lactonizing enzyme family protein [Mesorhizobium sp. WSM4875]
MQIKKISVYRVDLPLAHGGFQVSGGRAYSSIEDTVVVVETDEGISGIGESTPQGTDYLAAYAAGARSGISELSPHLVGKDPRELSKINEIMDRWLPGHPYVKTAIDMACWDILGKSVGLPVYSLMGGLLSESPAVAVGIKTGPVEEMTAMLKQRQLEGFLHFSAKVGDDPDEDVARLKALSSALQPGQIIVADANRGWLPHQALRVMNAMSGANSIYYEQPCHSYEECKMVRRVSMQPIILDECIDDVHDLVRAHGDNAAEAINLKISRVGGLTKMRQMRDLCASLGLAVYIQDAWGGAIVAAAIAHLAHSTPTRILLGAWDPAGWNIKQTAIGYPVTANGHMEASEKPGLGVEPNMDVLGEPVATYQ